MNAVCLFDYARLANAAYESRAVAPLPWAIPGPEFVVNEGDTFCGLHARVFVRTRQRHAVIAFRGTRLGYGPGLLSLRDLMNDAILTLPYVPPPSSVEALRRTKNWCNALKSRSVGFDDITLTGHSLGGAIAQVVGFRLGIPFVTFNSPGMWTNSHGLSVSGTVRAWTTPGAEVGVNFIGPGFFSAISRFGVHFGRKVVLKGAPTQHGIVPLMNWLEHSKVGALDPFAM